MFKNVSMLKKMSLLALVLTVGASLLLSSCVPEGSPDATIFDKLIETSQEESVVTVDDIVAQGEYLTIVDVVSITPNDVAVYGKLTEKAISEGVNSVRISGSTADDVIEKCIDDYFILPVTLPTNSKTNFVATAMKDDEEIGDPLPFTAPYDSTAEDRLDGKSVSVGSDSRLYFSSYLDDFLGEELYTASEVKTIKSTAISRYQAYETRADGADFGLIYVFVPDVTTVYPSIFSKEDQEKKSEALLTRYEQIVSAVSSTKIDVVDYSDIVKAGLENGDDITKYYRLTDSHMTEYGSQMLYEAVMGVVAKKDSDVTIYTLDDYTAKEVVANGGDYVSCRGLDTTGITEKITVYTPNFEVPSAISKIQLYTDVANNDYSLFTTCDTTDGITGAAERTLISTSRTELPNVLIYRDESGLDLSLKLAESFDQTLLVKADDYYISLTDATTYRDKMEGKTAVDFIIVIVSESNISEAFSLES